MQQSVGGETKEMAYVELAKGKYWRVNKSEQSVAVWHGGTLQWIATEAGEWH